MSGIFDQVINYAPPSLLLGTVTYKGTWSAATNTPTLPNPPSSITNGNYYVVSAAGTQFSLVFNIGDWIISNGSAWEKVDNTDAVNSVFGRTGAVVGVSTDYSSVGITATAVGASSPSTGAFTTLSATTPLAVASGGTGVASSTGTTNVVLSGSPTITTPVIAQINDASGNETLKLASIASAVNEVTIENAATGNAVHISATGGDASVGLHLAGKGASGYVNVQDSTDATKRIMFNAAGGTTNTRTMLSSTQTVDRTLSLPDATDTLVGKATTDTLTNKTLTSPTLTAPVLGTPASGNLASCTGYVGTSALVTVGALNSGSITSGFGSIDVGADAISGGALSGTTVAASGTITSSVASGSTTLESTAPYGTGYKQMRLGNNGSTLTVGVENSAGGSLLGSSTAYAGILSSGSTILQLGASGVIAATFTSTGLNSTAIGATTPSTGAFTTVGATGTISRTDSTTTTTDWLVYQTAWGAPSGNKNILWKDATSPLGRISVSYDGTNASMRFGSLYASGYQTADSMVLTTTGLAVTGTLSATRLQASGDYVSNGGDITLTNTGTSGRSWRIGDGVGGASGSLVFWDATASAIRMVINSSGNVGIGTASPQQKLHINDSTGLSKIRLEGGAVGATTFELAQGITGVANGGFEIRDVTAGVDRLVIQSDGNVGIGTTSALGGKLNVSTSDTSWAGWFQQTQGGGSSVLLAEYSAAAPNTTTDYFGLFRDNAAQRIQLRSNGGIGNYSANDVNLSDGRLKKDIIAADSYLDKMCAIEVVKFKYKDQTHEDYNLGVIAQQVEAVAPEFVDVDGFDSSSTEEIPLKSIYQTDLSYGTLKAVQELAEENKSLRKRLAALESK